MKIEVVAFAWYERGEYPRVLEVMEDAHLLPSRFDDWLQAAEHGVRKVQAGGQIAIKAYLNPDAFVGWCRSLGLNVNSAARRRYANEVAARQALGFKEH